MLVLATVLTALAVLAPPQKSKAPAPWVGRWMTSFGPLELAPEGKAIGGKFGWSNEGRLEAELAADPRTLEVRWRSVGGQGKATFTLWRDGRTFGGTYESEGGGEAQFWGGYRLERALAEARPGEVTDGQTELGLNYHLRAPKGFAKKDKKKRWTAVALLHGSNYNARDYVEGFPSNWPELAERYLLVGFDGEQLAPSSKDGTRQFNATYVNFSGDKVGEPWRYRQTPSLVAEGLRELSKEFPIERWYVGGHSQGGFLTYAVALFYPELVAGAFPVAGNLLVQCEPSYFAGEEWDALRPLQRRVPIAIVHGKKDAVVEFSTYPRDTLLDGGFPLVRLFAPEEAGHPWAFLPIDQALGWLDALNAESPETLLEFARASVQAGRPRDALGALARLEEKKAKPPLLAAAKELQTTLEASARPELERLAPLVKANADGSWVDAFLAFRDDYAFLPAAAGLMADYAALRAKHQEKADELFYQARGEEDEEKRDALRRKLVERYYASSWYRLVKGWLAEK